VIGTLVGMALPLQQNFLAIAIPAAIAAVAVACIRHGRSASARPALHGSTLAQATKA
jgi:AAHS family benzoate transporter-like MFS transporter